MSKRQTACADGSAQVSVKGSMANAQGHSEHLIQRGTNPIDCVELVEVKFWGDKQELGRVWGVAVGVTSTRWEEGPN